MPSCLHGRRMAVRRPIWPTCRAFARSCSRIRWRRRKLISPITLPSGSGTASACSWCVQAGETRVYSRSGDDISATFPELLSALPFDAVLDGELLVRGAAQGGEANDTTQGGAASFNALQQRLGRKTVSAKMLREAPAFVRLYDVLLADGQDWREHPWKSRRATSRSPDAAPARYPFRSVGAGRGGGFRRARRDPRYCARRSDRRPDAQTPRQPLCRRSQGGAVVQVETRSAADRLRDDVCAARQRQAVELLFGLHLRLLGGRPRCGRRVAARWARPIPASPMPN